RPGAAARKSACATTRRASAADPLANRLEDTRTAASHSPPALRRIKRRLPREGLRDCRFPISNFRQGDGGLPRQPMVGADVEGGACFCSDEKSIRRQDASGPGGGRPTVLSPL